MSESEESELQNGRPVRLRRATLVAAPLFVIGLMGCTFALSLGLWASWHLDELGPPFWIPFVIAAGIGIGAFTCVRGCFVDVREDAIHDVVAWIRIQRIPSASVKSVRIRSGFWRFYELTMVDGSVRVLLGATPAQFPSRLLAESEAQDAADLDLLLSADIEKS